MTNTWDGSRYALLTKENKIGSSVASSYSYSVNALGQRTALATTGSAFTTPPAIDWGYNERGELTSAAHSDSTQSRFYQCDAIGNREKMHLKSSNEAMTSRDSKFCRNAGSSKGPSAG